MNPTNPTGPGTLTQAIYKESLDPARLALITGGAAGVPYYMLVNSNYIHFDPAQKAAKALLTAALMSGLPIDTQIMLWGWDAAMTMQVRENQGYAWVPSYGMANVNVGPGLPPPAGETSNYPSSKPAGWIAVSTDAADYPAFVAPVVPVAPTVWTPDLSVMLQWTAAPTISNGVVTPGGTHYYFGIVAGQNPALGQACNFEGSAFSCQLYPNAEAIGGQIKMWLLVGPATA